jgi:hypothetical protein
LLGGLILSAHALLKEGMGTVSTHASAEVGTSRRPAAAARVVARTRGHPSVVVGALGLAAACGRGGRRGGRAGRSGGGGDERDWWSVRYRSGSGGGLVHSREARVMRKVERIVEMGYR